MMQDVPPDLLNLEEAEELDPDARLHQQEEDKRYGEHFFMTVDSANDSHVYFWYRIEPDNEYYDGEKDQDRDGVNADNWWIHVLFFFSFTGRSIWLLLKSEESSRKFVYLSEMTRTYRTH